MLGMRCPACGARYDNPAVRCPECGALQETTQVEPARQVQFDPVATVQETSAPKTTKKSWARGTTPSLIEFPGVTRTAMPQWRKELGERVREVQERRAREATIEEGEIRSLVTELHSNTPAPLELLPQAEAPLVNPLVVAALRRIERARTHSPGNTAVATAVVFEEQPEFGIDLATPENAIDASPKPERVHNLAVVPTQDLPRADIPQETRRMSRRIIDDQNPPALNYLDSVPTALPVEKRKHRSAPVFLRVLAAIADLGVIALLSSPVLVLTELANLEWRNPRVIGFAAGTFLVMSFLYLTVSIAFTGRTIGMKVFSLRVVDARTGMIPTGRQSAGRALVYTLSLASAGVALIYTFINTEKHTAHDRFTRTAVIRA